MYVENNNTFAKNIFEKNPIYKGEISDFLLII